MILLFVSVLVTSFVFCVFEFVVCVVFFVFVCWGLLFVSLVVCFAFLFLLFVFLSGPAGGCTLCRVSAHLKVCLVCRVLGVIVRLEQGPVSIGFCKC